MSSQKNVRSVDRKNYGDLHFEKFVSEISRKGIYVFLICHG